MRFSNLLTQNVRQILFLMIPLIWLGGQSLHYLMIDNANAFENLGALIVIWALINITLTRTKYASSLAAWEQAILWEHIKYYRDKDELRDQALDLTFDSHALQISQISAQIGVPNPFCENNERAIAAFGEDVSERFRRENEYRERHSLIHNRLNAFKAEYATEVDELRSWDTFLLRAEITMAVWGTVQTSYGGYLVMAVHTS
ncbi:MAG: hypothetical protein JJU15_20370 [Pararhodobacter sp.]|nr:hypothetical protein [Pararhodobacter sp.]